MRIDSNQTAQPLPASGRNGNPSPAAADARTSGSSAPGDDQAQFSDGHAQVQALVAEALQFPETRQEKVDALRQVVSSDSYQPSSQQVADAVFTHMLVQPAA